MLELCQVSFISIALYTDIQIISKQLHRNKQENTFAIILTNLSVMKIINLNYKKKTLSLFSSVQVLFSSVSVSAVILIIYKTIV